MSVHGTVDITQEFLRHKAPFHLISFFFHRYLSIRQHHYHAGTSIHDTNHILHLFLSTSKYLAGKYTVLLSSPKMLFSLQRRQRSFAISLVRKFPESRGGKLRPVLLHYLYPVRRGSYGWYLSSFPRIDGLKRQGMPLPRIDDLLN